MNKRRWFVIFGYLFGLGLVAGVFARLDWPAFWATFKTINLGWLVATAVAVSTGVLVRAWRWRLITGVPRGKYSHFWRATNIGYLGNLIFPGRAGEMLRMVIISRFAQVPPGQAVTSAVVDRVADGLMLVGFMSLVITLHGAGVLGSRALVGSLGAFGIAAIGIGAFVTWGQHWQTGVQRWTERLPESVAQRVARWYAQALTGVQTLRQPSRLLAVGGVTLVAFLLDYAGMWFTIAAFGWSLPFWAAITVGVFIAAGASLPSLPGYVGVYQVACLLALGLYGIGNEQAVAYSITSQVVGWTVLGMQGVWSSLSYGFNLSSLRATLSTSASTVGGSVSGGSKS